MKSNKILSCYLRNDERIADVWHYDILSKTTNYLILEIEQNKYYSTIYGLLFT